MEIGDNNSSFVSISVNEKFIAWNLNAKESLYHVPGAVFVVCLLIIGLPGNCLVVYVYHYHFKRSTASMYIKVLAILDALCCMFGMTFEIVDMFFPLLNGEPVSCKMFRTIEQITEYISAEVLLLIAYDRYLHICRPLHVFTFDKARRLVIIAVAVGIVISAPTTFLMGRAYIDISGITVHACSLDSALGHKGTTFAFVYYLLINAVLFISFTIIIVIYMRIWYAVCKWRSSNIGKTTVLFVTDMSTRRSVYHGTRNTGNSRDGHASSTTTQSESTIIRHKRGTYTQRRQRALGTTGLSSMRRKAIVKPVIILFAVSFLFIIGNLPYFILLMLDNARIVDHKNLAMGSRQLWEFLYKSYFLGNVFNSVIYCVFDRRFRRRVFDLLFRARHYERVCCRV